MTFDNNLSFINTIGFAMIISAMSILFTLLFVRMYGFEIPNMIIAILLLATISILLVGGTIFIFGTVCNIKTDKDRFLKEDIK